MRLIGSCNKQDQEMNLPRGFTVVRNAVINGVSTKSENCKEYSYNLSLFLSPSETSQYALAIHNHKDSDELRQFSKLYKLCSHALLSMKILNQRSGEPKTTCDQSIFKNLYLNNHAERTILILKLQKIFYAFQEPLR